MPESTTTWQETISRGVAIALMHNFTSVAEALKELVDNAIDYRWGQSLAIEIAEDKRRDSVVIESDGGRGMGAEEIQVWLNWGEGEAHDPSHIGKWHQGGKAACGFLGRHVRLWAKRAGSTDVWFLEDEDWGGRLEPKDFGAPQPLVAEQYPPTMRGLPKGRGHVRIELTKLAKEKRWNLEVLKRDLSSTYRWLLQSGGVRIRINGEGVPPLDIPLSTAAKQVSLDVRLSGGRSVAGWAGRMQQDQLTMPLKPGLRLVYNGRLIKQGEWFGYNHEGKGALNSLIGELVMRGFTPVPNKTDFVDRGDEVWDELAKKLHKQLEPLVSELGRAIQEVWVSKEEKKRAREVAGELERVFASFAEAAELAAPAGEDGSAGPPGPDAGEGPEPTPALRLWAPDGDPQQPPLPLADPAGSIARLLAKVIEGRVRAPLRISSWDPTERSAWTAEGGRVCLDINKNYHLYKAFNGAKPYLAETAILELCKPREGEPMGAAEYVERVNLLLLKWSQVDSQPEAD